MTLFSPLTTPSQPVTSFIHCLSAVDAHVYAWGPILSPELQAPIFKYPHPAGCLTGISDSKLSNPISLSPPQQTPPSPPSPPTPQQTAALSFQALRLKTLQPPLVAFFLTSPTSNPPANPGVSKHIQNPVPSHPSRVTTLGQPLSFPIWIAIAVTSPLWSPGFPAHPLQSSPFTAARGFLLKPKSAHVLPLLRALAMHPPHSGQRFKSSP